MVTKDFEAVLKDGVRSAYIVHGAYIQSHSVSSGTKKIQILDLNVIDSLKICILLQLWILCAREKKFYS